MTLCVLPAIGTTKQGSGSGLGYEFTHAFARLMEEKGLLKSTMGTNCTLYSFRHTYATNELLAGTDIHTLAKQMGTSVLMLEKHYSKMTATMAAAKLA